MVDINFLIDDIRRHGRVFRTKAEAKEEEEEEVVVVIFLHSGRGANDKGP